MTICNCTGVPHSRGPECVGRDPTPEQGRCPICKSDDPTKDRLRMVGGKPVLRSRSWLARYYPKHPLCPGPFHSLPVREPVRETLNLWRCPQHGASDDAGELQPDLRRTCTRVNVYEEECGETLIHLGDYAPVPIEDGEGTDLRTPGQKHWGDRYITGPDHPPVEQGHDEWFKVPRTLATRARAKELRESAEARGCTVLDFSETELLSAAAADELVANGRWDATTGESPDVRGKVVRALTRRGLLPSVHREQGQGLSGAVESRHHGQSSDGRLHGHSDGPAESVQARERGLREALNELAEAAGEYRVQAEVNPDEFDTDAVFGNRVDRAIIAARAALSALPGEEADRG